MMMMMMITRILTVDEVPGR